ncbi:MAG: hypothetical protein LIR46_02955 [Bacteroidota bacterium]|nr:hypothetical protein [Bacteroidota bacterium]
MNMINHIDGWIIRCEECGRDEQWTSENGTVDKESFMEYLMHRGWWPYEYPAMKCPHCLKKEKDK